MTTVQDYYSIGLVLVSLVAILEFVNLATSIWSRVRRRPSIDATLQDYVRREEFERLRAECRDNDRQIFDILRALQSQTADSIRGLSESLAGWQRGIERQIGRIEGAGRPE